VLQFQYKLEKNRKWADAMARVAEKMVPGATKQAFEYAKDLCFVGEVGGPHMRDTITWKTTGLKGVVETDDPGANSIEFGRKTKNGETTFHPFMRPAAKFVKKDIRQWFKKYIKSEFT
jgi:hypothetical protein